MRAFGRSEGVVFIEPRKPEPCHTDEDVVRARRGVYGLLTRCVLGPVDIVAGSSICGLTLQVLYEVPDRSVRVETHPPPVGA